MSDREELEALRRMAELEAKAGSAPKQEQAPAQPNRLLQNAQRIGRGFINMGPLGAAAQGAGTAMETIDEAADIAGGATTDVLAKVAPPEVAAGVGTAVKLAPTLVGALVGQSTRPSMESSAKTLMHQALKPSGQAIQSGDAARAIDTLLKENANISAAGNAKLRGLVQQLNADVAKTIAAAPGATVDKSRVAREVFDTLKKFQSQVNKRADVKQILASWKEFSDDFASKIPVAEAQRVKQGTYRILSDKYAKGGLPAIENEAGTQTQMAMARGLRLGMEENPLTAGVKELNAREHAIINALELSEKRAGIAGNKDLGGIAWLAQNPPAALAMMADRSAAFKSWLANKIYQHRVSVPAGAGAAGMGVYQASQQDR